MTSAVDFLPQDGQGVSLNEALHSSRSPGPSLSVGAAEIPGINDRYPA
ncbi:unannotated protein [freshwater metagenome]|jgi:hypothetical protein|uniref:Unannotated protein n=1 Tax=freshwater metagenome TaxID=449393 RepID=A0A6J6EV55_9ZZZZ